MAKKRKAKRGKYKKRGGGGMKLKNSTIYMLFALGSIGGGAALLASYTQANELLATLNTYLVSYFGGFSFLVPIVLILFGLFVTGIKTPLTKPTFFFGFALLVGSLIGLFQSGQVGQKIFAVSSSVFGSMLTVLLFTVAGIIALMVCLNITFAVSILT